MNSKQRRKQGRQLITLLRESSQDEKDRTIADLTDTIRRMGAELDRFRRQPQSSLKDHEVREMVDELRTVAYTYHATQQLRSQISDVVHKYIRGVGGSFTPYPYADVVKAHVAHCLGCEVCDAWRKYLNE